MLYVIVSVNCIRTLIAIFKVHVILMILGMPCQTLPISSHFFSFEYFSKFISFRKDDISFDRCPLFSRKSSHNIKGTMYHQFSQENISSYLFLMMHQFIWEHTSQTVSKNQEDSVCRKKGLSIPSILSMPQYVSIYFTEYVSVCRVY